MAHPDLAHTLADAFNTLADEVQTLTDRKTVLEHKLRFAHEQFQYLADKYAPAVPEIADTLVKLQLPSNSPVDNCVTVPLPRSYEPSSQHHIALVIRDGRRIANQLTSLGETSKTTGSSRSVSSPSSHAASSMSTVLEQDFTVQGKKGHLQCPFSKPPTVSGSREPEEDVQDPTPHLSQDPICAAMYDESTSQHARTNVSSAGKCPIRYMDKHSPEEIAHYVETHKHELPRSHEICLRRYQRDEDQVKKIDSKYGDMASMIEGLGQLHQPMLPEADEENRPDDVAQPSNERVENWAHEVSVISISDNAHTSTEVDGDRQSHFDRPLKEVRVGESPSRPWGISVPIYEPLGQYDEQPLSPPPAPVRMPSPVRSAHVAQSPAKRTPPGKCPFDHTQLAALRGMAPPMKDHPHPRPDPLVSTSIADPEKPLFSPTKETIPPTPPPHEPAMPSQPAFQPQPTAPPQPAFINPDMTKFAGNIPQMVFTGPVFIGYPMDQAIQFMNQYRGNQ